MLSTHTILLSPFIWLFLLVFLCSSSYFLSTYASCKYVTALCNRVYLPNSRSLPLSQYCLMAPDRAFWREKTWILSCSDGTPHLPEIHIVVITSKTFECRFIIEHIYIYRVIFTFKYLKAFVHWIIKHSVHFMTRFCNLVDLPTWDIFFLASTPAAALKVVPRFFTICSQFPCS